jgi:subtilisin family serine protease
MKLNAVKFKDKASFDKNKGKSNVATFDEAHNVVVFKDKAYIKPDKTKVSHVEQILKEDYGVPNGIAILKSSNYHIALGVCQQLNINVIHRYPTTRTLIVEIPEHMAYSKFYDTLMATRSFDFVEQDIITKSSTNANFTYNDHWQLIAMDAQQGWDIIAQNPPTQDNVVAVFDIGCETTHPDLVGQVINTLNVVTNTANVLPVSEFDNHGTPCVGLVVANPTNGINTIGVAGPYTKASFVNLAVMNNPSSFSTTTSQKVQAVNHAISIPNCVAISMSFGGDNLEQAFEDALLDAQQIGRGGRGIVCCASSGNNSSFNNVQYPAYYQGVCSIGAVQFNNFDYIRAGYSNYGVELFASAPGSLTPATDRTGAAGYSLDDTTYFNGTSAACPVFAGGVAAIASANPNLTAIQIKNIIAESCIQIGGYDYNGNPIYPNRSYEVGYGMMNIANAVALAVGGTISPDPNIPINIRVTVSAVSLTFPDTNIPVTYTIISNKVFDVDTTIAVTIFKSANNTPPIEPADTVLTTFNVIIPAGQYRYQGTYSFVVDASWVGLNYIGVYAATLPGELFSLDNYGFRSIQVVGETPPPNLNLKVRIQQVTLNTDNTKAIVYFDVENTGNTPVTRFTIRKGFVGYDEYNYEVFYDLQTDKFYVEETVWELLPPTNFLYSTPFRVQITSVNGIFPDDVTTDNSDSYNIIPVINP